MDLKKEPEPIKKAEDAPSITREETPAKQAIDQSAIDGLQKAFADYKKATDAKLEALQKQNELYKQQVLSMTITQATPTQPQNVPGIMLDSPEAKFELSDFIKH